MILLVAASSVPLAVAAAFEFASARALITAQAEEILGARADRLVAELDGFHAVHRVTALRMASLPVVAAFCRSSPATSSQARELEELLGTGPASDPNVRGIAVLDLRGTVIATTEPPLLGRSYGFRSYFGVAARGAATISDIYLAVPEVQSVPTVAYAAPVLGPELQVVGVVAVFVRAQALWDVVRAVDGGAGHGSFAVIYDSFGVRVAHSSGSAELFHPAAVLDPATLEALVSERRFGDRTRQLLDAPLPAPEEFRRALDPAAKDTFRATSRANEAWCAVVTRKLRSTPWTVFFLAPEESLAAPVRLLVEHTLEAIAVILALAVLIGFTVSRRIARPIQALLDASEAVRAGDLHARVRLTTGDEFGALGESFNRLAAMTLDARQDLEEKIGQRTEALERARAELEGKVAERTAALEEVVSASERQNRALQERGLELSQREVREQAYGRAVVALAGEGALALVLETALREARTVGASLMVCFRITPGRRLAPLAGVASALPLGTTIPLTGFSAEALATRRLVLVEPVPDDVELRFDAGLAGWRPKSLALVPLFVGEREVGLVAVGALAPLGAHALGLFTDLALPLALTILRHDLGEETRRFSEELEARNGELHARGDELRAQGAELEAQRAELETKNLEIVRASQLKTDFLANMSHELRTPLNAVIGFSDLLLEEARGALGPKHARYVEDILGSGRHLLHLINDILDLVKIEAGRVTLAPRAVAPAAAVADALTFVAPAARKKRITLETDPRAARSVQADPDKLRQILLNLLSNAVKFSPEGSSVVVSAADAGEYVRFSVRDHGPGIDDALLRRLFEPFVQGESALVKAHEGTGLGLAIAKRLVEQHGGAIETSAPAGGGTTFSFTIPVGPGAARPTPAGTPRPPVEPRAAAGLRPVALLIEDEAAPAQLLRAWLEDAGYDVAEARTAASALDLAERLRPRLILLDLVLDGDEGLRLLQELEVRPATRGVPVVVTSGVERGRGVTLGAVEYIKKPLERAALMARLRQLAPPGTGSALSHVLVIDDDPQVGAILRSPVEAAGYRLETAHGGLEGLAAARREAPALILLDIQLPDLSGIDVAEALAADPRTRDIPIIVLTARDLDEGQRARLGKHVASFAAKGDITREALIAATSRRREATPAAVVASSGQSILVVDDHDLNRELVRNLLERQGHTVLLAGDGETALAVVRRDCPALVLMDLAMPKMDGFAAVRALKADLATRDIPVVALTALAMRSDEVRVRAAGFDGYLTKPIERLALERAVAAFLTPR